MNFATEALWGLKPQYGLDDNGEVQQFANTYWWSASTNGNYSLMRDYLSEELHYTGFNDLHNPQPEYMEMGGENRGLLNFQLSQPLYRAFNLIDSEGSSKAISYRSGCDVFVDQLVQFTRRDEGVADSIASSLPSAAKFACWVASDTNVLVVTAGRYAVDDALYAANYITSANVVTGRWYRLTVRAIANAATQKGEKAPALAVYLDGVQVTGGEDYSVGDDEIAMADRFRGNIHYLNRGLFPALSGAAAVHGVAFRGIGRFDELGVVNSYNPLMPIDPPDQLDLYVAMDPLKVTNVVVWVEDEVRVRTNGVDTVKVKVLPEDTVRVEVLTADDYATSPNPLSYSGNTKAVASCSGFEVTMADAFVQWDPVTVNVNVDLANYEVDGVYYESVVDAMKAANASASKRFTLGRDLTISALPSQGAGQIWVDPAYSLVFDLHGRTLRGEHFQEEAAIYNQGRLTIIDTVGGGAIVAPGKAIEVATSNTALEVNYDQAALTLGAREYPNDFSVTGRVLCTKGELTLKGGTYVTPPDLMPTNRFYLEQYVAPERYRATNNLARSAVAGELWTVSYDGSLRVNFEVEHGGAMPAFTNVSTAVGAKLLEPAITNAVGYQATAWQVKGSSPSRDWNFTTDEVTDDMTLVARQQLENYTIKYENETPQAGWPTQYSVVSARQTLPTPTKRDNYVFQGWLDLNSGREVAEIGAGARWQGREEPVAGNLHLEAQWQAEELKWTNLGSYTSESNGVYAGEWTFTVPVTDQLPKDTELVVDEIDFALVNPLTFPKSAPCLAVTPAGGECVLSATRPTGYDAERGEYAAATNRFTDGRVKIAYAFSGLTVRVGAVNTVRFSSSAGTVTPTAGFLRLALKPAANDSVFGNCSEPEEYREFCPIYEVSGHVKEADE